MKEILIKQYLKDVTDCGLYFCNALRVRHECLGILFDNGYDVAMTTKGEPQLPYCQKKEILDVVYEAESEAFNEIRNRPGVREKLEEQAKRLAKQEEACANYYLKNDTRLD